MTTSNDNPDSNPANPTGPTLHIHEPHIGYRPASRSEILAAAQALNKPQPPAPTPMSQKTQPDNCLNCGHPAPIHDIDPADGPDYCAHRGCRCEGYVHPQDQETANPPIDHDPRTVDTTTRCECRHTRALHRLPKGREPGKCTEVDCTCARYVEGQASPLEPPEGQPDSPPTDTDCKCGHRKERHELPHGRCKAIVDIKPDGDAHRCTCETYRPTIPSEPPTDQTACPTCGEPYCHNCRHHRVAHRAPSHPPGKYTACQHETCACLQYESPPAEPTYSILYHTDEYRGDHSAEVAIGIADKAGETIEDLFTRIAQTTGRTTKPTDYVTIRVEATNE